MFRDEQAKPYAIERIVSALTYPTTGIIGVIWLILGWITKSYPRKFTQYHIYQSIFLSLAFVILDYLVRIIANMFAYVPIINRIIAQLLYWFNMPVLFEYSIIQIFIYSLLIYLTVTAFLGKYSYIPFVSDNIKQLLR